jgi:hypothetical protein
MNREFRASEVDVTEGAQTISSNDGLEDDSELDDIVMKLAGAKIKGAVEES